MLEKNWSTHKKLLLAFGASGGGLTEYTATGNPLSFVTNVAKNLVSLVCPFTPTQSGTGDPSPTNVRPISGVSAVKVVHLDENLLTINRSESQTSNGITFTPIRQDNKTYAVHIEGTLSLSATNTFYNLNYSVGVVQFPVGSYKPSGYSDVCTFRVYAITNGSESKIFDSANQTEFTVTSEMTQVWMRLQIPNAYAGQTINETVYPIVLASDNDTLHSYPVTFPALGKNLLNLDRTEASPNPTTLSNETSPRVMDTEHYFVGIRSDNYYYKNYVTASVSDGTVTVTVSNNNDYGVGFPVEVEPGQSYTLSATAENTLTSFGFYDDEWRYVSGNITGQSSLPRTVTIPTGVKYMVVIFRSNVGITYTYSNIQLEKGSSATAYEPYTNTVYGGSLDVTTGVLTVTDVGYVFTGNESMAIGSYSGTGGVRINSVCMDSINTAYNDAICNGAVKEASVPSTITRLGFRIGSGTSKLAFFVPDGLVEGETTADKFIAWLVENNIMICTKLAAPEIVATLTPQQITALIGDNTIWSDTNGSNAAVYYKKG